MTRVVVVTSFSAEGFTIYGQRFLRTFEIHAERSIELMVFAEMDVPLGFNRGAWFDLMRASPQCLRFVTQATAAAKGRDPAVWRKRKSKDLEAGYSFRYDAAKFCCKVFALDAAARLLEEDSPGSDVILLWLDADIVVHAPFHRLDVTGFMEEADLAFLGRGPHYHSECGMVGYRLPQARAFLADFAALYESGRVFDLEEWHDSWVFDWLRRRPDHAALRQRDLGDRQKSDIFRFSIARRWFEHLKGDRKYEGVRR